MLFHRRVYNRFEEPIVKKDRWLLRALALTAVVVAMLPLLFPRSIASPLSLSDASIWYMDFGLLLVGITFITYGILGRCGKVLFPNNEGYRINAAALILLLAFPLYILYIGNDVKLASGDTLGLRNLAPAILTKGTLDLSVFPEFRKKPLHYSAIQVKGRVLSSFPIGTSLLALPYTSVGLIASGGKVTKPLISLWEKNFAALASVASVCLFFLGVRRRFGEHPAIAACLVFACATTVFSASSQAMWSFTREIFFVSLALYLLLPKTPASAARSNLARSGDGSRIPVPADCGIDHDDFFVTLWFYKKNKRKENIASSRFLFPESPEVLSLCRYEYDYRD